MLYPNVCFYVFATVLVVCSAMVVSARNPVHSVLFLIAAFLNAAVLFLVAGAEFLALILAIVYVGAVAVLFIFVVMMLDIDFERLRGGFQRYVPVGVAIGVLLLAELAIVMIGWPFSSTFAAARYAPAVTTITNTDALGRLLYTDYILPFQTAGLILLVAMISAIVLTLRDRRRSRHQVIAVQTSRTSQETLAMVRVAIGAGVKPADIRRPAVTEPGDIDEDPLDPHPHVAGH